MVSPFVSRHISPGRKVVLWELARIVITTYNNTATTFFIARAKARQKERLGLNPSLKAGVKSTSLIKGLSPCDWFLSAQLYKILFPFIYRISLINCCALYS